MPIKSAGFLIFRRKPTFEFLLIQAAYRQRLWSPPKGMVDEGEDELATALRELNEETGLNEEDLRIHRDISHSVLYDYKDTQKQVTYWPAEMVRDTPIRLSEEHQDYRWFPLEEAQKVVNYQSNIDTILDQIHGLFGREWSAEGGGPQEAQWAEAVGA